MVYPRTPRTTEPAAVFREIGNSRVAYFAGDVDRTCWRSGNSDLSQLLQNAIRWVGGPDSVVSVNGVGLIEAFAWETEPGYALHLLNYTNPNAHHGWMQSVYPLGPQTVRMKLLQRARVKSVELLRGRQSLPFNPSSEILQFTIPRVEDYEVAAITVG